MSQQGLITDFSAGELSPRMAGRVDLPFHAKGAEKLENWVPFVQGGITTRPGLKYIGACHSGCTGVRLVAFNVSATSAFILEMGVVSTSYGYMRIWYESSGTMTPVMSGGNPLIYKSSDSPAIFPYTTIAQIREIQFAQDGATLYMAQVDFPPRMLTWSTGTTFTLGTLTYNGNVTPQAESLPPSGSGNYPRAVAIWGGRLWFGGTANSPQRIWCSEVYSYVDDGFRDLGYTNWFYFDTIATTVLLSKPQTWNITGNLTNGSPTIAEVSLANAMKVNIGDTITGTGVAAYTTITAIANGSVTVGLQYTGTSGSVSVRVLRSGNDYFDFTATREATRYILTDISIQDLIKIRVGDLLSFTGMGTGSQTLVTNVSNVSLTMSHNATASGTAVALAIGLSGAAPEYYEETTYKDVTTDAHAMDFTLGSDQNEQILWMAAGQDLVVGCSVSEFIIPAGVTALNPMAKLQTRYGSSGIQGMMVNSAILFSQAGKTRLREYYYKNEDQAYKSPELTYHAEHILGTGIREWDFAQGWQPMVYAVRTDGTLAALVYANDYGIQAWCRIKLSTAVAGTIESVAVVVDTDGTDDVYVATLRGSAYYLERFDPLLSTLDEAGTKPACNLDCYELVTKGSTNTVARFANLAVYAVYNGVAYSCGTADGNGVFTIPTLSNGTTNVGVGLAYTCEGTTTRTRLLAQTDNGYTNNRRLLRARFILLTSYSFEAKSNEDWHAVTVSGPYTGDADTLVTGDWDTSVNVSFRQTSPLPVTICAISPEVT